MHIRCLITCLTHCTSLAMIRFHLIESTVISTKVLGVIGENFSKFPLFLEEKIDTLYGTLGAVVLTVWSLDQQQKHHLGIC